MESLLSGIATATGADRTTDKTPAEHNLATQQTGETIENNKVIQEEANEEDFLHDEKAFKLEFCGESAKDHLSPVVTPEFAHQVIQEDCLFRDTLFESGPNGEPTDNPRFEIVVRYTPLWRTWLDMDNFCCDSLTTPLQNPEDQKQELAHELYKSIAFPADPPSTSDQPANRTLSPSVFQTWLETETREEAVDLAESGCKLVERHQGDPSTEMKTVCVWELDGTNPKHVEMFDRAQAMATWFIETASLIDCSDPRWTVLLITEEQQKRSGGSGVYHSIAGFTSIFEFTNPCRGDQPHILRVCQFMVLPHLHGKGVAEKLLLAAYQIAISRPDVFELTIETPNEKFSRLRDAVDCRILFDHEHGDRFGLACYDLCKTRDAQEFLNPAKRVKLELPRPPVELTKGIIELAHRELKLTTRQIVRCYEIMQLGYYQKHLMIGSNTSNNSTQVKLSCEASHDDSTNSVVGSNENSTSVNSLKRDIDAVENCDATANESNKETPVDDNVTKAGTASREKPATQLLLNPELKEFRLAVKRRLYRENVEELSVAETKDAMKQRLAELYEGTNAEYCRVLKRLGIQT